MRALKRIKADRLLRRGYTTVRVRKSLLNIDSLRKSIPLDIVYKDEEPYYGLLLGNRPNFILEKDGKPRYAVVNGALYQL